MPKTTAASAADCLDSLSRRSLLTAGLAGLAGSMMPTAFARAARRKSTASGLRIADVRRTTVKVPYRETPARNMDRELPHWRYSEICEVRLQSGHTGFGESLLYYTWGATEERDVRRAADRNAAEIMWDDSLGAGLQMALFDAVARTFDVPIHALLGTRVHDKTPLSWWNIDTSPEDMAAECGEALRQGYTAYKTKGRPWFDVWKQVELAAKEVPESFKIDMDFNDTLLDAERAIPILLDLEKHPQVGIYETPIPQTDIAGNRAIRQASRVPVAMHYGRPKAVTAIREEICDGFIIGGGASRVMRRGAVSALADKPFWLQMVGTGITAAFSLQFGGVLSHATWPAVNCHQLYTHTLLTEPITVTGGTADVPDGPGLGYELDRDAVARLKVPKPPRRPEPRRLMVTTWPDGRQMYVANTGRVNFMLDIARKAKMPYFERGVTTRLVPDDGSDRWRTLYEQARKGPVMKQGS